MAGSVYEFIATKNKVLVNFLDENANFSALMMKIVKMLVRICDEKNWSAPDLTFEVYSPRAAEEIIIIRLKNKGS